MQSRLEQYGINKLASLILTYCFFLLIGIAMIIWLGPLVYQQLQSLILEIPKWVNSSMIFVQDIPSKYPDLISSDPNYNIFTKSLWADHIYLSRLFKSLNYWNSKHSYCCNKFNSFAYTCFFFLFDRESIISSFLAVLPKERAC